MVDNFCVESHLVKKNVCPSPPPLPSPESSASYRKKRLVIEGESCVPKEARDLWDRLFDEAHGADVFINTDGGGTIYAHASILGMASPVFQGMLKQAQTRGHRRIISISGVPHEAVRVFIRYVYSSCYEQEEMEECVLHLLVLSHVYMIPQLKRVCERQLENGMVNTDNLIDIFQLALLCDVPRLSFICLRMTVKHFKAVAASEGWKAMKQSHPVLEQVLLQSVVEADTSKKDRLRKASERKIYLQLYEAMEALVHIYRDGCKTIGPHDKVLKQDEMPCKFDACKGLELLVRHFAGCELRVPGGCARCKRMWQLLELHSRLCADSEVCRVPLCKSFKMRINKLQDKKEVIKWRILVRRLLRAKSSGGSPFFTSAIAV